MTRFVRDLMELTFCHLDRERKGREYSDLVVAWMKEDAVVLAWRHRRNSLRRLSVEQGVLYAVLHE